MRSPTEIVRHSIPYSAATPVHPKNDTIPTPEPPTTQHEVKMSSGSKSYQGAGSGFLQRSLISAVNVIPVQQRLSERDSASVPRHRPNLQRSRRWRTPKIIRLRHSQTERKGWQGGCTARTRATKNKDEWKCSAVDLSPFSIAPGCRKNGKQQ